MLCFWRFCSVAMCVLICGCGGGDSLGLVGATGAVTIDGNPLVGATVTMRGSKGELSNGFTDSEGKFKMTTGGRIGVPVGTAKVGITKYADSVPVEVNSGALKAEDMQKMQIANKGKSKDSTPKSEIPEKYGNPDKSGLTAVIEASASRNVFEFPLVTK